MGLQTILFGLSMQTIFRQSDNLQVYQSPGVDENDLISKWNHASLTWCFLTRHAGLKAPSVLLTWYGIIREFSNRPCWRFNPEVA